MKLSEIARLPSFALLGRGFGGGQFTLLSPLAKREGDASIVLLSYEETDATSWSGSLTRGALDVDVSPVSLEPILEADRHAESVATIREAIAAGDVYQVNLTVRAKLPATSGETLFATLCRRSIPSFVAWVRLPDGTEFVSASPELFFSIEGRTIRSQPMKGTAEASQRDALAGSEKDAAELAMITDLIRNDLTQVCEPRTVHVECERRFIELPYAVQAVSDVVGTLRSDATIKDVLTALHPGGSVTGAPKKAACRIIRELETSPRGVYCGTLGFVEGEHATFSLLIRTASRTTDGWTYGVGGGIVWDSDAAAEWEEIRVKLGALR